MTNISHASLAGSELHEPKGIATAPLGTVYVANGSGSGNWSNVGSSSFTGMIADFTWPVVQSGWLELDGSDINTTTYAALYNVMTIQQNGTRTNGTGVITSLTSTANTKVPLPSLDAPDGEFPAKRGRPFNVRSMRMQAAARSVGGNK